MSHTACLVCLVSTVSGGCKNSLGRTSASSRHITKLEQSTFLRYLWVRAWLNKVWLCVAPPFACKCQTSLKKLTCRNTLAYFSPLSVTKKSFIALAPRHFVDILANLISSKTFFFVIKEKSKKPQIYRVQQLGGQRPQLQTKLLVS